MTRKLYKLALWYIRKLHATDRNYRQEVEKMEWLTYKNCSKAHLIYGLGAEWESVGRYEVIDNAIQRLWEYEALGTVEELKEKIQTELPYMSLAQARFKSELDEYRNLGTVEELKEAREKQVAKKPIDKSNNPKDWHIMSCPCCGRVFWNSGEFMHYEPKCCEKCGQRFEVGEEDEV